MAHEFGHPWMRCGQWPLLVLAAALVLSVASTAVAAQSSDYVVGPKDVLTITVWDQPDLSGPYSVEADGTFTFPLIGRIKAGGLTLRGVEAELKTRLADGFFRNPQVRVAVEQYRSQQIFIMGDVKLPGSYPLTGEMTLIEALARAGSTASGAAKEILIVRPTAARNGPVLPDQAEAADVIRVDLGSIENGGSIPRLKLRDGDTIYVQPAEMIYVFGQVKSPGAYAVHKDTTVLQTLALAGGLTDRGSTGRIRIVRVVNGKKKEISAKLSDRVLPGDTIVVRERFF